MLYNTVILTVDIKCSRQASQLFAKLFLVTAL